MVTLNMIFSVLHIARITYSRGLHLHKAMDMEKAHIIDSGESQLTKKSVLWPSIVVCLEPTGTKK
jgi:hypothetical protein